MCYLGIANEKTVAMSCCPATMTQKETDLTLQPLPTSVFARFLVVSSAHTYLVREKSRSICTGEPFVRRFV